MGALTQAHGLLAMRMAATILMTTAGTILKVLMVEEWATITHLF